jgi:hydroxymethylglutaryl-CoA lyase
VTEIVGTANVTLIDVSLRDGLQDEPCFVTLSNKIAIAKALYEAGFRFIEATSFVHPTWVPQLADAAEVVGALPPGPRYSALTLNRRGFDRAVAAFAEANCPPGTYDLTFVVSASERHAVANNNRTIVESLRIFADIGTAARAANVSTTATIACAFGSPWDDERIDSQDVAQVAERLVASGARRLTLADTVGLAEPDRVVSVIRAVQQVSAHIDLAIHLHDRIGLAFANVDAALGCGVHTFEGALAGLGGCPFVPDAPGNVDLTSLDRYLQDRGRLTGLDPHGLQRAAIVIRNALSAGTRLDSPPNHPAAQH